MKTVALITVSEQGLEDGATFLVVAVFGVLMFWLIDRIGRK